MHPSTARLTIDLDALAHNYAVLVAVAGRAEVAPVVKADAYGLGVGPVARRLWREGARSFFVARLDEGEQLRAELGGTRPAEILVLDGAVAGSMPRLVAARLTPVLSSLPQIEEAAGFTRAHGRQPAAIHIDTGMNRLGLRPEEVRPLVESGDRLSGLDLRLVMSHLACSTDPENPMNRRQADLFREASARLPAGRRSLANSGGTFLGSRFLFDIVRPGISLYGGAPFERPDPRIQAVARVEAPILQVRAVPAGESIGYGASFTADRPMRIAIAAAGYADGFLRGSSPAGGVWFDGQRRRLTGRVSMDLVSFDVTDCEAARPGAVVELLGPNAPLDAAAHAAGTAPHELLVRLGDRLGRTYVGAEG